MSATPVPASSAATICAVVGHVRRVGLRDEGAQSVEVVLPTEGPRHDRSTAGFDLDAEAHGVERDHDV